MILCRSRSNESLFRQRSIISWSSSGASFFSSSPVAGATAELLVIPKPSFFAAGNATGELVGPPKVAPVNIPCFSSSSRPTNDLKDKDVNDDAGAGSPLATMGESVGLNVVRVLVDDADDREAVVEKTLA